MFRKISCLDVKPQMVMTKDNLTVTIDAVCFYRVLDATKATCLTWSRAENKFVERESSADRANALMKQSKELALWSAMQRIAESANCARSSLKWQTIRKH